MSELRSIFRAEEGHEWRFRMTFDLRPDLKGDPYWEAAYEHAAKYRLYPDEFDAIGLALVRIDNDSRTDLTPAPERTT